MNIKRIALAKIKPSPYNPRIDLKPGDKAFTRHRRSQEEKPGKQADEAGKRDKNGTKREI